MIAQTRRWFGAMAVVAAVLVGTPAVGRGQDQTDNENGLGAQGDEVERLALEARTLYDAGKYEPAIPILEKVLGIFEKELGSEHPYVARVLNDLALLRKEISDYKRAEPLYQRALHIREKVLGRNHQDVAQSLNGLANLYLATGEYERAEPLYWRTLGIYENIHGKEDPEVASVLNNLAMLYKTKGDYHRAEPLYLRALDIREKMLGPDAVDVANSLNNLAGLYDEMGDVRRAEPLYQRTLAILQKALGLEHPHVATVLNNLAELHVGKGDYSRAEPLFQRALAIREKVLGPDHPDVAQSLNNLAGLYERKGDYRRALPLCQRALAVLEKVLGPEHPQIVAPLNNLARIYERRGDFTRAEALCQRALSITEKALGHDHPEVATLLNNLAVLYEAKGDVERAEQVYLRVLTIVEKALGPTHPFVATSLNNLALLNQEKGDLGRAEPLYRRALAIWEKSLGPNNPNIATTLNNLAGLYWAHDDIPRALQEQERGISSEDRIAVRELAVGADEQRRAYMAELGGSTKATISLHIQSAPQLKDAKQLAVRTILRRKGLVLDAMANSFRNLRERLGRDDQKDFDRWIALNAEYSARVQRGPNGQDVNVFRNVLKQLADERQKIENALSHVSKDLQAQINPVTLEQVQTALPTGSALVELYRYQPFNPKARGTENPWGLPRVVAYALHPDGRIDFADLGEAKPIEDAAKALRDDLSRNATEPKPNAKRLHQLVMAPVQKLLGNTLHIYFSPDGELNLVPFEALVDETDHYVVESYAITYLPSGRDLVRRGNSVPSRNAAIVFAGPDYEVGKKRDTAHAHSFDPLLHAQEEASAIATSMTGTTIRTGAEATEAAVKALKAPRFLHIATHGFFAANESALHASPDKKVPWFENPLSKSGLAFAGANRSNAGENDGLLTALEASQLDLWGTKLVVLSACNTGNGKVENGDSVYGLRRAFGIAGAETIVMSLWQVDGRATTELMKSYYQGLSQGGGRAESLRQAQLGMLHRSDRSHPYYWASFIMSGDDRSMEGHPVEPTFGRVNRAGTCGACEIGAYETNRNGVWLGIVALGAAIMLRRRGVTEAKGR